MFLSFVSCPKTVKPRLLCTIKLLLWSTLDQLSTLCVSLSSRQAEHSQILCFLTRKSCSWAALWKENSALVLAVQESVKSVMGWTGYEGFFKIIFSLHKSSLTRANSCNTLIFCCMWRLIYILKFIFLFRFITFSRSICPEKRNECFFLFPGLHGQIASSHATTVQVCSFPNFHTKTGCISIALLP